jgi:hypothetical protein
MNFNVQLLQQGVNRLVRPDLLLRTGMHNQACGQFSPLLPGEGEI